MRHLIGLTILLLSMSCYGGEFGATNDSADSAGEVPRSPEQQISDHTYCETAMIPKLNGFLHVLYEPRVRDGIKSLVASDPKVESLIKVEDDRLALPTASPSPGQNRVVINLDRNGKIRKISCQ